MQLSFCLLFIHYSQAIKVNSALDNVDVDATTGDLWVGSHPVTYKIMVHIDDPEKYPFSPSHVSNLSNLLLTVASA